MGAVWIQQVVILTVRQAITTATVPVPGRHRGDQLPPAQHSERLIRVLQQGRLKDLVQDGK